MCSQYLDSQFLETPNVLSFWTNDVTNIPKVTQLMSLPICHFRFSIFVLESLKFKKKGWHSHWQCNQYLELNPTCDHTHCARFFLLSGNL